MTKHISVFGGRKAIYKINEAMVLLGCLDHLLITAGHSTDLASGDEEQNGSILPPRLLTAKVIPTYWNYAAPLNTQISNC